MAYNYVVNKELNKINEINTDYSFDIKSVCNFIMENYKQILLLIIMFVIIYVVEHITYYNALFYGITSSMPLANQQHTQTKSNSVKKNRKTKK